MQRSRVFFFILFFSLMRLSVFAQEIIEDDLSGFEDDSSLSGDLDGFVQESIILSPTQESQVISPFSLGGNFALKSSYGYREHSVDNVEYSGFNEAKSALYLQLDYKLYNGWKIRVSGDAFYDTVYTLHDKPYNRDVLDTYETQLRFDDVYLQGALSTDLDLKLGRQIVVWGKSDSIRVTDVINPLDNRVPGITDIEDLRLSTTMLKLDYYTGAWNFSAMAIAENRIFLEAAPRGEYFPVDSIFPNAPNPFIELIEPESDFKDMQYAFALNGLFSGWDLSLYAADVLDSRWHLEGSLPNAKRVVSKIGMLGLALNIVQGSWLFKSEFAYLNSLRYNSTKDLKSRLDTLVGFDYMGIQDSVLSFEIVNRHIFDYESQMSGFTPGYIPDYTQEDEVQSVLRATRSFSNDTLDITLLLSTFGSHWQYGGFFRASLEYEIIDALVTNFGVIDYLDTSKVQEKPFMNTISNNDKIFLDLTYSF